MRPSSTFTVAIASGKGGTGKTLIATSIAVLLAQEGAGVVIADCDVEAPNAHLFLPSQHGETMAVETLVASVEPAECTACGVCRDACAFGAVRVLGSSAMVFDEMCHGCGLCANLCPTGAIREISRRVGEVTTGQVEGRDGLTLVSGRLDVGQVKAPSVIRAARAAAAELHADCVVLDAPPGVACSAVAATRDADALLLVTEPTPFGLHDLTLSVKLGHDLGLPMAVVVNRVHDGETTIETACGRWGIPIVARIPFERQIAARYATGGLPVDSMPHVRTLLEPLASGIRGLAHRSTGAIV